MSRDNALKGLIFVSMAVLMLFGAFSLAGYLVAQLLGMPLSLGLPVSVRFLGLLLLASALSFMAWFFTFRKPADVFASTYLTFLKAFRRIPRTERSGRTEPLVVKGPYRYVRHPLYFGVVVMVFSWWLLLDYSFLPFTALFLFLWFDLVVIPFEEKELRAIFGREYEEYARRTPRIFPFTNRDGELA